jgi:mono/diheme cytochrome c family protein
MRKQTIGVIIVAAGLIGSAGAIAPHTVQAQAGDGSANYARECARCHGDNLEGGEGPQLMGPGNGLSAYKTAAGLLQYAMENMPNDQPSSLSPSEYASVIGFILSKNGVAVPDDGLTLENGAGIAIP